MFTAMRCSAAWSFIDSPFHRSTTSRKRAAATPPHTDGGTLPIRPMKDCSIARISSLRASVLPATAAMRSKSVVSGPPPGVVIRILPCVRGRYEGWTRLRRIRFHWRQSFSEHRVSGPNRLIAGLPYRVFVTWCALAADGNSQRPVDQHHPQDAMVRAYLAIRHHGLVRSTVGRIELDEYTVGLLAQRAAQRRCHLLERLMRYQPRLRDVHDDIRVIRRNHLHPCRSGSRRHASDNPLRRHHDTNTSLDQQRHRHAVSRRSTVVPHRESTAQNCSR